MLKSDRIRIESEVITTLQSDALTEMPILERVLRESIAGGFMKGIDLDDGRLSVEFPYDEAQPTRWQHYANLLLAIDSKAQGRKACERHAGRARGQRDEILLPGLPPAAGAGPAASTRNCEASCWATCTVSPPSAPRKRWMRTGRSTQTCAGRCGKRIRKHKAR